MYYLDENMVKMATSPTPSTTPNVAPTNTSQPTANPVAPVTNPNAAANNTAARVDPKPKNQKNDPRKNSPAVAPALPSANTSTTRMNSSGSVEARTLAVSSNSNVPMVNLGDEPPPTPAPRPTKPVSGGVLNGTAILLPPPAYPESAKRMKVQGIVAVEVVLDETGKVISATATSGPPMLREPAIQAAKRARFSPTKLSGMPVKVSGIINYKFALVP
jgi:protein TonB